jgi:hypothetical protein
MAKRNSSNQDFTVNIDGWDLTAGLAPRKLAVKGGDVTLTGGASATTYTFPTVTNYSRLVGANGGDNAYFSNDVGNYATTVNAGTTTTLTFASKRYQYFTAGTAVLTQTCKLPDATTLELGTAYEIINESLGSLNVVDGGTISGITPKIQLPQNTKVIVRCIGIGSAGGTWEYQTYSTEGVVLGSQYIMIASTTTRTMLAQAAAQSIFNVTQAGTTAGALNNIPVGNYAFECLVYLTNLSTTASSSFGFALGGTATFTSKWMSTALKGTLTTAAAHQTTFNITNANTTIATASNSTTGYFFIKGTISCTVTGTLIPQMTQLSAFSTAAVNTGSYFKIDKLGTTAIPSVGNWI